MKKITIALLLNGISLFGLSQTQSVNISFTATQEANVNLGVEWNHKYTERRTPVNVSFDGNNLKMYFDNGKIWYETKVLKYKKTTKTDKYSSDKKDIYTLKVIEKGFVNYIIIEKNYGFPKAYEIKTPYVGKEGFLSSYHYFYAPQE